MNITTLLGPLARADTQLARRIVAHQHPAVAAILPRLSNAANHSKLWLGFAAVSAISGGRRGRRAAQRGMVSIGLSSAIANGILKPLFPRVRPPVNPAAAASVVRRPASSSFPSGHSASAAAFATATAMEAPAIAAPISALAAAVAYSRITTGVHYPSDVIAGTAIGAAVAAATTKIWPRTDPTPAAARFAQVRFVTEPSPSGAGLVIVINAAAGSSADESDLQNLEDAFPDATVVRVADPSILDAEFRRVATDAVALGVLGGDGTISAAATAAIEAEIPLVVFPGGTLNHFARDLGVDSIDDAISAVRHGHLVEVDAATIDGRLFLNTASFGSYPAFVEAREKHENSIGKWPAMVIALIDVLLNSEPVEADLNGSRRRIWMIFIGNCAYDPPGFAPASRPRLDDEKFDVRIVDGNEPNARLRLIAAVLTGQLARSSIYTRELVDELHITTATDSATLAADGETFAGNGTFTVTKMSTRLRTYAPHR